MTSPSTVDSLRPIAFLSSFVACTLLSLEVSGCAGTVQAEGQDPGTTAATCAPASGKPAVHAASAPRSNVNAGVFIADTFHFQQFHGEGQDYVIVQIDAAGVARIQPKGEIAAPANLVQVVPGIHVRLQTAFTDPYTVVQTFDTSDPTHPKLLDAATVDGTIDDLTTFTVVGQKVYYCTHSSAGGEAQLAELDLTGGVIADAPVLLPGHACGVLSPVKQAAQGPLWIAWDQPTGNDMQSTYAFILGDGGSEKVIDYGYSQGGVHQYGNVLTAWTSDKRAAFDPENATQYLLMDPSAQPARLAWAQLSLGEPAQLLGVADAVLYLSTAGSIQAYDITDIQNPAKLPYEAKVPFGEGTPRLLATSDRYLAVVDGAGLLFLVPRDNPGTVEPLQIHETDYTPATPAVSCPE
jgi:hypothetical protein